MALASPNGKKRGPGKPFKRGNPGGPGNPLNGKVEQFRCRILQCTTPEMLDEVWASLRERAKAGDVMAIREFLSRLTGKPQEYAEILAMDEKQGPPKDGVQAEATWLKQMLGFGADIALIDRQLPVVIARWRRGLYAEWGMPPPPAKQVESKPVVGTNGNGNGNGQH